MARKAGVRNHGHVAHSDHRQSGRESGQAAVEAALTLPLLVFMILGTLQLFLMLQARIVAEYAVFMAARVGSVNHGSCTRMTHAAVATLLPTFDSFLGNRYSGEPGQKFATAFQERMGNSFRYKPARDEGHDREIIWLLRPSPLASSIDSTEDDFDDPDRGDGGYMLEVRLVYWYPLRIPFANWVMSRMFMAALGVQNFTGTNPTMLTQTNAQWQHEGGPTLEAALASEMQARVSARQYVFPIQASFAMRMMTPPRSTEFATQNCSP